MFNMSSPVILYQLYIQGNILRVYVQLYDKIVLFGALASCISHCKFQTHDQILHRGVKCMTCVLDALKTTWNIAFFVNHTIWIDVLHKLCLKRKKEEEENVPHLYNYDTTPPFPKQHLKAVFQLLFLFEC